MTAPDTDTLAGLLTLAMPAMDGLRRIKAEDWSVDMPCDGGWACVGREDNSPRIIVIERGWGKTADARQDAVERLCILSPTLAAEVIALRAQAAKDKARIERLEAALREAEETLRLVEHPAFPDPAHHQAVKALGLRIGFGALMSTASAAWRETLEADGYTSGGEYVAGPCFGTVASCLAKIRATLEDGE